MYYSLDSKENNTARLIGDDGEVVFVSTSLMPQNVRQGDIFTKNGKDFVRNEKETENRRKVIAQVLKQMLSGN